MEVNKSNVSFAFAMLALVVSTLAFCSEFVRLLVSNNAQAGQIILLERELQTSLNEAKARRKDVEDLHELMLKQCPPVREYLK